MRELSLDPINKLVEEHRTILSVLEVFNYFARDIVSSNTCDKDQLGRYVKFIREYADKYHHAKEEDILFATMAENGFSQNVGPIAVMLHEHVEGRKYVQFLWEASREPGERTEDECRAVVSAIRGYADLLRAHIYKENNILYPMAREHLPKDIYQAMTERFDQAESSLAQLGSIASLELQAADLIKAA